MMGFNNWFNSYVKTCARKAATETYLATIKRGHCEDYAKMRAREVYMYYLQRNLE